MDTLSPVEATRNSPGRLQSKLNEAARKYCRDVLPDGYDEAEFERILSVMTEGALVAVNHQIHIIEEGKNGL